MVWMRCETEGKGTMQNAILRGKVKGKKSRGRPTRHGNRSTMEITKGDED